MKHKSEFGHKFVILKLNFDHFQCFLTNKIPTNSLFHTSHIKCLRLQHVYSHFWHTILISARIQCAEPTLILLVNFLITSFVRTEHWLNMERECRLDEISFNRKWIHTHTYFRTRIKSQLCQTMRQDDPMEWNVCVSAAYVILSQS